MRSDRQPLVMNPADYSPDMPSLDNPGSSNMINCVPRTPMSYGPFPALAAFGSAITAQCLGAVAAEDSSGNNSVFAGDATDLFQYTSVAPANVSKAAGSYTLSLGERWRYLQFGQRLLATDYDDAIQAFILGTSSKFADLANGNITSLVLVAGSGYTNGTYALTVSNPGSGTGFAGTVTVSGGGLASTTITNTGKNYPQTATFAVPAGAGAGSNGTITPVIQTIAPSARFIAAISGFCVVANTVDPVNGAQTQRVWWSALNDPTNWPTPGTTTAAALQSSYNDLFGDGGFNMGLVGNLGNADGAVFQERAVWRVLYTGPPATFAFVPAEGVKGTPAPNSIVHLGPYAYYLGQDGFYRFDGSTSLPIGTNKVDKTFYGMVDQNNMHRIDGCADPLNKLIYWAFPSLGNVNGNPDTILVYNYVLDKWSIVTGVSCETILYSFSFGYTLATMPIATLLSSTIPLLSRVWTGGNLTLTGFNTSNNLSYFNGTNLAATLETSETQPFPGQIAFIQNPRPLVDAGIPAVALASRNRLVDVPNYNQPIALNPIGTCPQIINGRYIKAQVTIPAGTDWSHFQGVEVEPTANGVA